MDTVDHIDLIKQLFRSYSEKNIQEFLSYFSPDIIWIEPGDADIPYSGTFKGIQGVVDFLGKISQLMEMKILIPTNYFCEGDLVTVLGNSEATIHATGKSYRSLWVYVFTIADNKIKQVQVHMDTLAIAKAFRP